MTKVILFFCIIGLLVWIFGIIYLITDRGFGRWLYHDLLGWHKPTKEISSAGILLKSQCKYCKKEITQDSQGNWY